VQTATRVPEVETVQKHLRPSDPMRRSLVPRTDSATRNLDEMLRLQRAAGNTAVARLIRRSSAPVVLQRRPPTTVRTIPTRAEIDERAAPIKRMMKEVVKSWKEESRWGVQNFVNAELEAKIDDVRSSGLTASSFLLSLAGNLIWAAACFTTGGAAFGISVLGIGIAASGSLPGDKKLSDRGAIAAMAKEVQNYLDQCETGLKAAIDQRAHELVLFNQDLGQSELLELFIKNSFRPEVLAAGPDGRLTELNPSAVREAQQQELAKRWKHFKETVPLAAKQAGSEYTVDGRSDTSPKGGRLRLILVQGGLDPATKQQQPPRWGLGLELWPKKFGIAKWVPDDVRDDVDRRIREVAGNKLPPLTAEASQVTVPPDQFWQVVDGMWVAP
jgi:hypothetical protein